MGCGECARELPDGAAFCPSCGAEQTPTGCVACAAQLVPRAAFCVRCGTPVAGVTVAADQPPGGPGVAGAERRITSVLFADLVSYTALAEARDSEDVRELLTRYFEVCSTVVRRYGGAVEKFIGDAVMAVWGVPTSHEDDAERAVRAGLELVSSVAELGTRLAIPTLSLRAGVVTGEVAANLAATDQGMVAGDPVNTAARIQAAAGPGEVWVDPTTRSLTAAGVTYTDVGRHELKGKAKPVQLYRAGAVVAAVGGTHRVDGLEAPLAGRDRQLRMVKELFHTTVESRRPLLVVLDGEAGIGKTRLAWEFEKYSSALEADTYWHRGRCLSYGDGVAYWALAEAVRTRLGLVEEDPGTDVSEHVEVALRAWVPDAEERAWLGTRLVALVGGGHREFEKQDLFGAWTTFFERLGESADAVTLVIDDAQHADEGLLAFLEHLVAHAKVPLYVLLVARPELLESRPGLGGRRMARVPLEPLNDDAMDQLVDGLVDGLTHAARRGLVARADGVPLYAVETVRALIDRDLVTPTDGRYVVTTGRTIDLGEIAAPPSLRALVAARLDALPAQDRRVVGDASVLGTSFTREGIGYLCSDVGDLDEVLVRLQRKEIIGTDTDRFSAERGQFRFVQTVVRQVAYGTLTRRDRKARHLVVADHLAAEGERAAEIAQVIAQHLLDAVHASGPDDGDVEELRRRAAEQLVTAGDRACALSSFSDGKRAYAAALELVVDDVPRAHVLAKLAKAGLGTMEFDAAISDGLAGVAILDGLGDVIGAADCAASVARCHLLLDHLDAAVALAEERLATVSGLPEADRVSSRLARQLALSLQGMGRYADAVDPLNLALRLSDRVGDHETFAAVLNALAIQQSVTGSVTVAEMLLDAGAEFARRHELWESLTMVLGNRGYLLAPRDMDRAIELTYEAGRNHAVHGLGVHDAISANLCTWLWVAGRWEELDEQLLVAAEVRSDAELLTSLADAARALRAWAQGGVRTLGAELEAIPAEPAAESDGYASARNFRWTARALADGDLDLAVEHGRACLRAEFEINQLADDFPVYWPVVVRAALGLDDTAAAWELTSYARETPTQALPPAMAAHARVFRAVLAIRSGEPDVTQVEADLREGIAELDSRGVVVWRAMAQEDLGRWLLQRGCVAEAAAELDAARATYSELGASAWLARLDAVAPVR